MFTSLRSVPPASVPTYVNRATIWTLFHVAAICNSQIEEGPLHDVVFAPQFTNVLKRSVEVSLDSICMSVVHITFLLDHTHLCPEHLDRVSPFGQLLHDLSHILALRFTSMKLSHIDIHVDRSFHRAACTGLQSPRLYEGGEEVDSTVQELLQDHDNEDHEQDVQP